MIDAGVADLRARLLAAALPPAVRSAVEREVDHLEAGGPLVPDRASTMAWIDLVLTLPWQRPARAVIDLDRVRGALEREHLGQERAKQRILEALASARLRADGHVPALALVGPPGVGKSAIPRTLALALDRPLVHLHLSGVTAAAQLEGERRLVPGAQPGRVLEALRSAGVLDPVLVLEEVDAFSVDYSGDTGAALLPLLDPTRARTFLDRWLGVPLDLSGAVVVVTAYTLDVLELEVQDALHVVPLRGYVDGEKRRVAREHLLPRLAAQAGLTAGEVRLPDETLQALIEGWTFESGVRGLESGLLTVLRRLALRRAEGEVGPFLVEPTDLSAILGPRSHRVDRVERMCQPGVAMGLAWTPAGGQVLFIEASAVPGRGTLKLTGSLGEVMKESAEAALTWLREHTPQHGRVPELDVHIHVPEGGVPKDGPSAGLVLLVAVASALTGRVVRHDLALTGEITLRGTVLPIGGVREKILAAQRAGVRAVVLPKANAEDLADVPPEVLAGLEVHLVERIEEALLLAFGDGAEERAPRPARPARPARRATSATRPSVAAPRATGRTGRGPRRRR